MKIIGSSQFIPLATFYDLKPGQKLYMKICGSKDKNAVMLKTGEEYFVTEIHTVKVIETELYILSD